MNDATCWTLIRAAAAGDPRAREEFSRVYHSVLRAYLVSRWRGSPLVDDVEDAVQEAFLECFRSDGILERVEPGRPGGFRAYVYGAIRNLARRHESEPARQRRLEDSGFDLEGIPEREATLSQVFDREWARALMRRAGELLRERAAGKGDSAARGVQILELRFGEGLPVRKIAAQLQADPARIHQELRTARRNFYECLKEVVASQCEQRPRDVEQECEELMTLVRSS